MQILTTRTYALLASVTLLSACSSGANFTTVKTEATQERPKPPVGKKVNGRDGQGTNAGEIDAHAGPKIDADARRGSSWTFDLAESKAVETSYDLATGQSDRTFPFSRVRVNQELAIEQPQRAMGMLNRTQGSPRKEWRETFNQRDLGVLDVLLVIDTSGSMSEEQNNLSTKLSALINAVGGANWQIGVITTDPAANGGGLRALIRKSDADASTLFKNAVNAGLSGSGNERGVLQSVNGLKAGVPGGRGSWLRTGSAVGVLIVSDEDNCSKENTDCNGKAYDNEAYLVDHLRTVREPGKDARVYGLFGIPGQPCATAKNTGVVYQRLVEATGGASGSICASDYSATLSSISNDLRSVLKLQYQLAAVPESGSLVVKVGGVVTSDYVLKGDVIEFSQANPPAAGAAIEAAYVRPATDHVDSVTLPEVPGSGTLSVSVGGLALDSSKWTFTAASRVVKFATPPAEGARLEFRWKRGELRQQWTLGDAGKGLEEASLIDAGGRAVDLSKWSYASELGRVSFVQAPAEGSSFKLKAVRDNGVRESYDLPETAASATPALRAVGAYDESGKALEAAYTAGAVKFRAQDVVPGKKVKVVFTARPIGEALPIERGATPESVKVSIDGLPCEHVAVKPEGIAIDESKCALTDVSKVKVAYAIPVARTRVALPEDAKGLDSSKFEATLDGKPFPGLKVVDGFLVLDGNTATSGQLVVTWAGAK